ncbi:MAG TPA: motility protein A [Treponema sp.]|jgi:chemotaxis protein MotA|nr:motility protein A [Treponema sp.]HBB42576.1 motility protein A [Treponema sp.]HCA19203.1 motility protein A [Treponema sp.]
MDFASFIGFFGGLAMIMLGVISSGSPLSGIIDIPSVFVTVGGSYFSLWICAPINQAIGVWKILGRCFKKYEYGEEKSVRDMVRLSEQARREGILALEDGLDDLEDKFLSKGLRLMVDGHDGSAIRAILENDMAQTESRHMEWINVVTQWAGFAPGFGMMGTVIGLIGMLNNLEDKSSLGPNMAVALVTTLYGSFLANWLFGPMAEKLKWQNNREMVSRDMVLEGVLSIQTGDNPRILATKLLTYLEPKTRKVLEAELLKD